MFLINLSVAQSFPCYCIIFKELTFSKQYNFAGGVNESDKTFLYEDLDLDTESYYSLLHTIAQDLNVDTDIEPSMASSIEDLFTNFFYYRKDIFIVGMNFSTNEYSIIRHLKNPEEIEEYTKSF